MFQIYTSTYKKRAIAAPIATITLEKAAGAMSTEAAPLKLSTEEAGELPLEVELLSAELP